MTQTTISMCDSRQETFPDIKAIRLQIKTRWKRPTTIPGPVLANVLRGALGITLRKLVCPQEWLDHDCSPCPLYEQCAYGKIFMPTPSADAQQLRLQQDLPRPFVIEPPGLHPEDRVTSEGLTFRLMLFGTAIESLPFIISTLDRLGADGLGRDRVPFSIERIATCHPAGEETLFAAGSDSVALPRRFVTTQDLLSAQWPIEPAPSTGSMEIRRRILARMGVESSETHQRRTSGLPTSNRTSEAHHPLAPVIRGEGQGEGFFNTHESTAPSKPRLKLKFLTPLLLKSGSRIDEQGNRISAQEIRDRPPFGIIIRRLRDRLSSLCTFFGERWDCPDFAGLGSMADQVTIIDSHTNWLTRSRTSTRTGQSHEISGLVGQTTYEFPDQITFDGLLPLMKICELIHVGKNAPWGNGGVQLIRFGES